MCFPLSPYYTAALFSTKMDPYQNKQGTCIQENYYSGCEVFSESCFNEQ